MRERLLKWPRVTSVAACILLTVGCDRWVIVKGAIRTRDRGATGACKARLMRSTTSAGREWTIKPEFEEGVNVDPLMRPRYHLVVTCERCAASKNSTEFVAGKVDLGVLLMEHCSSRGAENERGGS
jgi:hypothetical protein